MQKIINFTKLVRKSLHLLLSCSIKLSLNASFLVTDILFQRQLFYFLKQKNYVKDF